MTEDMRQTIVSALRESAEGHDVEMSFEFVGPGLPKAEHRSKGGWWFWNDSEGCHEKMGFEEIVEELGDYSTAVEYIKLMNIHHIHLSI